MPESAQQIDGGHLEGQLELAHVGLHKLQGPLLALLHKFTTGQGRDFLLLDVNLLQHVIEHQDDLPIFEQAELVCCQLFFPATTTIFPDHPVPLFDDRVALSSDIRLSKTRASLLPT